MLVCFLNYNNNNNNNNKVILNLGKLQKQYVTVYKRHLPTAFCGVESWAFITDNKL